MDLLTLLLIDDYMNRLEKEKKESRENERQPLNNKKRDWEIDQNAWDLTDLVKEKQKQYINKKNKKIDE